MQLTIKLLFIASFFLLQKPAPESLANTKWTGTFNVPESTTGILEFGKDTVILYVDNDALETMLYKQSGDTLTLKKISGGSPCGEETGDYKYGIKDNRLTIALLKDECGVRANAFSAEGYKKEEK